MANDGERGRGSQPGARREKGKHQKEKRIKLTMGNGLTVSDDMYHETQPYMHLAYIYMNITFLIRLSKLK